MQVRREVNEKSGGTQTPGEYNQLFDPIVLNGGSQLPPPQPILNSNLPSSSIELARVEPINAARNQRQQNLQPSRQNLGAVFVNSLGQRFVPVPGIVAYFCVWHTRVSDYEKFVADTSIAWKQAGFSQAKDHPVVRVSYYDAIAFCNWLTTKETNAGLLPKGYEYRLPKDLEWSAAVGITAQEVEGDPLGEPEGCQIAMRGETHGHLPRILEITTPKCAQIDMPIHPQSGLLNLIKTAFLT